MTKNKIIEIGWRDNFCIADHEYKNPIFKNLTKNMSSTKFKVGEKVRLKKSSPEYHGWEDMEGVISEIDDDGFWQITVEFEGGGNDYFNEEDLELVFKGKTSLSKLKKYLKDTPDQTAIKFGLMTEDLELTEEGLELFNQWLFNAYKEEFLDKTIKDLLNN